MVEFFNYYGLCFFVLIMFPNILFAVKSRDMFENVYKNKAVEVLEQVGRYGCSLLMIFVIPYTSYVFFHPDYFAKIEVTYLVVNGILSVAYIAVWFAMKNRSGILRAALLSGLPSLLFLFSGLILLYAPLIVAAIIFAVFHIFLSIKNALLIRERADSK